MQAGSFVVQPPGRYNDFAISFGQELLGCHRGVKSEVGGALSVFETDAEIEVVPGYSARAITSGGPVAGADFERMATKFQTRERN